MNINKSKRINAASLLELASYLNLSDTELDEFIIKTRNKFVQYQNLRISEALPHIVAGHDIDSVMLGAILMCFTSDYMFDEYFKFATGE